MSDPENKVQKDMADNKSIRFSCATHNDERCWRPVESIFTVTFRKPTLKFSSHSIFSC